MDISGLFKDLFRHDEWNVGIVHQPISAFLEDLPTPEVHWLPLLQRGKYLADPFAIVKDQIIYVLCEEFDYRTSRGRIVAIELKEEQVLGTRVAIDLPFHVAYPYLFEHEREAYCVPETSQANEVALFKAIEFPFRWVKVRTLLSGFPAVDSTVFQYEGSWWLTCTSDVDGSPDWPDYCILGANPA
jgi:hypothetical protein